MSGPLNWGRGLFRFKGNFLGDPWVSNRTRGCTHTRTRNKPGRGRVWISTRGWPMGPIKYQISTVTRIECILNLLWLSCTECWWPFILHDDVLMYYNLLGLSCTECWWLFILLDYVLVYYDYDESLVCYHYIYTFNVVLSDPTGAQHPAGDPRVWVWVWKSTL
jgi:hypothetical protein